MDGGYQLLERQLPLASIDAALQDARRGLGSGVWLQAAPGLGKTALLREALQRADRISIRVLHATATQMQADAPFGVMDQLLPRGWRGGEGPVSTDDLAVVHRGVALLVRLAEQQPLLIAVDDMHWADVGSVRCLQHLAERLQQLPVALVLATRPGGSGARGVELRRLGLMDTLRQVTLAPLSAAATAALIGHTLPGASAAFCASCLRLTHGSPYLLRRLLGLVDPEQGAQTCVDVEELVRGRLDPILDDVAVRTSCSGPAAQQVVEAIAVLGDAAHLADVVALSGATLAQVIDALDGLSATNVLVDALPVAFVYPLVRAAVYQSLPAGQRIRLHRAAAAILSERHAPPEQIAAHLLELAPAGDPWVVGSLRDVARRTMAEGAGEASARYLRRAVAEPPSRTERVDVVLELAHAEACSGADAAVATLRRALESTTDPDDRGRLLHRKGWVQYRSGHFDQALSSFKAGGALVVGCQDLRVQLTCGYLGLGHLVGASHEGAPPTDLNLPLDGDVSEATRREVAVQRACAHIFAARDHAAAARMARGALGGGAMLSEEGATFAYSMAVSALCWCDVLDEAIVELDRALAWCLPRGDAAVQADLLLRRAQARFWLGELGGAAADAASAAEIWSGSRNPLVAIVRYVWASALVELGDLDGAVEAVGQLDDQWPAVSRAFWSAAQGRVALASGVVEDARASLRRVEALAASIPLLRNPAVCSWRADAALAAWLGGATGDAVRLAGEDRSLAEQFGAPRVLGAAVRMAALVGAEADRLDLLTEAVRLLEPSPSDLERARALVDLGAELRRRGRQLEARGVLTQARDLTRRRGLIRLEERALTELRAAGARPRQRDVSGPGALTETERRVVEHAAQGHTNREIAHMLFVTPKTVEWHLSNAYPKLGVMGRRGLAAVLQAPPASSM